MPGQTHLFWPPRMSGWNQKKAHTWRRGSSSIQAPEVASNFLMGFFWQAPCTQSLTGMTGMAVRGQEWLHFSLYPAKLSVLAKLEAESYERNLFIAGFDKEIQQLPWGSMWHVPSL